MVEEEEDVVDAELSGGPLAPADKKMIINCESRTGNKDKAAGMKE